MASKLRQQFKEKLQSNLNKSIDGTKVKGVSHEKKIVSHLALTDNEIWRVNIVADKPINEYDKESLTYFAEYLFEFSENIEEGEIIPVSKFSDSVYDLKLLKCNCNLEEDKMIKEFEFSIV